MRRKEGSSEVPGRRRIFRKVLGKSQGKSGVRGTSGLRKGESRVYATQKFKGEKDVSRRQTGKKSFPGKTLGHAIKISKGGKRVLVSRVEILNYNEEWSAIPT